MKEKEREEERTVVRLRMQNLCETSLVPEDFFYSYILRGFCSGLSFGSEYFNTRIEWGSRADLKTRFRLGEGNWYMVWFGARCGR